MATRTLPDDPSPAHALHWRQRSFVHEYVSNGRNAALAYQTVYDCSPGTAEQGGWRLLANPLVRVMLDDMDAQISAQVQLETGVTLARTVAEIAKLAFFDPRKLFDANGDPRAIEDLDDDTAAALAGLEVEQRPLVGSTVRKYKLAAKITALDMLMKHLGGYAKNNAIDLTVRKEDEVPLQELARRAAYLFQVGMAAANDAQQPPQPRQAAS